MKASVIICTCNRADSLRTALQCLEWQTYDDFEVIVVNGPSTDHTDDVLQEYEGRIRVLNNPEPNCDISRNMGADAASGDILCYIDDDSEPDTQWLCNVMHEFSDECVGIVTGPTYDTTGTFVESHGWLCDSHAHVFPVETIEPFHSYRDGALFAYTHGCNMSLRRSLIEKIGGFIEEFVILYEEPEICKRIVSEGYKVVNSKHCSIIHRSIRSQHTENIHLRSKGLLHEYHAMKNSIYLRYIWKNSDESMDNIDIEAHQIAKNYLDDGKYRFERGIFTLEEWNIYRCKIDQALKWGMKHGKLKSFSPRPIMAVDKKNFLPFSTKRNAYPLTICFLAWTFEGDMGGPGFGYITLAKALAQRGHEVHLISPGNKKIRREFKNNIHWHFIKIKNNDFNNFSPGTKYFLDNAASFYKKILELQEVKIIDIVMGFIFTSSTLFSALSKQINTVITLCTTHKTWCKTHPHWKSQESENIARLEALSLSAHTHIHSLSNFITEGVQKDYPDAFRDDATVFTIPIGVEGPPSCPLPRKDDGRIRIFFLGRLERRKGPDILLAAAAQIMRKYKQVDVYMAGNDQLLAPTGRTYRQDFEAQYIGTDIGARVHFLGFINEEEKWRQYALCDIYCMPSRSESFGIPFVEAMACGKPVVGCRAGGMPEVITEGETGLLAEPGDVESLVACLESLIADTSLRKRMGKAARRRYEQEFTSDKYAERMEREFYRITGKGPQGNAQGD